jgi:hypothetical protein
MDCNKSIELWNYNLEKLIHYIINENKQPSQYSNNTDIKKLGQWLLNQKTNYKNKKNIMKNENIFKQWTLFIDKYKEYIMNYEELWKNKLNKLIYYIIKENKIPSLTSENKDIKILSKWLSNQKINYKNKTKIMKNTDICKKWENFLNEYLLDNKIIWKDNLKKTIDYIIKEKVQPSQY